MDELDRTKFQQTFNFHGRLYWLNIDVMDVLNYCYSYNVPRKAGAAACSYKYSLMDFKDPNVPLYEAYLKFINEGHDIPGERAYLRSKLYNVIDQTNGKVADTLKAIGMLIEMLVDGTGASKAALNDLTFDQLLALAEKMRASE